MKTSQMLWVTWRGLTLQSVDIVAMLLGTLGGGGYLTFTLTNCGAIFSFNSVVTTCGANVCNMTTILHGWWLLFLGKFYQRESVLLMWKKVHNVIKNICKFNHMTYTKLNHIHIKYCISVLRCITLYQWSCQQPQKTTHEYCVTRQRYVVLTLIAGDLDEG